MRAKADRRSCGKWVSKTTVPISETTAVTHTQHVFVGSSNS